MHYKTILFCGWGRAGKDEGVTFLSRITSLRYTGSTSWAALPDMAKMLGLHPQVAWETRHQRRMEWYHGCNKIREAGPTTLIKRCLEQGELCAGIRDKAEIEAAKAERLFDRIVWVARPGTEKDPTVVFGPEDCDEIILNNGSLEHYHDKLFEWAVKAKLPLVKTDETIALFRRSRFYSWHGERVFNYKTSCTSECACRRINPAWVAADYGYLPSVS